MNTFWKTFFGSILGVWVALFLIIILAIGFGAALVSASDQPVSIRSNSLLHIKLDKTIPELTDNLDPGYLVLDTEKTMGLHEILATIDQASRNDKIKGIFLEVDLVNASFTTVNTIRDALIDFKASGKFIIAYSDFYSQQAYFLSTAADEVYVNPIGLIDIRGFSATVPFYTDLFDKIGLKMNVFYAGKFKSATEPFRRTSMSPENKLQTRSYLTELYDHLIREIAASRDIDSNALRAVVDDFDGLYPEKVLESRLVDGVVTRGEIIEVLKKRLGLQSDDSFPMVSLLDFNLADPPSKNYSSKNKIAVIHAEGTIMDGEGDNGMVGSHQYVKVIRELKTNSSVKAIVLRVNSPGGSALASENILRELNEVKAGGLPVVVSMGDYAASGGYYISCGADSIFAQPTTITGSIGVFSIFPDLSEMMNDKVGIHFDTVNTADLASAFSPFFAMSTKEVRLMNQRTENMYQIFLKRVADGRGMTIAEVNEIAQGRVWTGKQALERNLVDALGDLDAAIQTAASMAGLQKGEYRIANYPYVKDPWVRLIEDFTGKKTAAQLKEKALKDELGKWYPTYKQFRDLSRETGVQARMLEIVHF